MSKTVEVRLNFTAETAQAEQALNRLQTSLRNISTQSNMDTGGFRFTQELNSASDAAIKLRQNLSNAINTNTNKLDLSKFRKEMDKSGMSLEKYRVALQQIGPEGQNAFVDLSKAILASQTPLTHSIKLFDKLWDTLKRTAGWQISSLAVHGIQGALSDAYDYAQDLNKSLNNIRIVTGYSADRMADFAKQANKAAKELSSTTLDYTDASLIYYQQGLDDKAVKERTDTTIKMANVTGTTAETVSQQMTAVWENFMKDGQHATEYYADVMAALGATTASSTDEIADGLEKFAAVADTVGLSYEYATSALATITAKTRQSADVVGTALKTLFARIEGLQLGETLEDGTTLNKYSSALEAVGVNIKDDTGNLKDMDNILSEIGAKWETLSKDQQVALAQTVAGVRQYTQFVALMDNWDFMGENLATAYGAEGTLEKQQKIYEESWEAARNRLQASMETLYNDLLKDDFFIWLTDALSDVVGLIDKIVDSMGGLTGLLPGLILLMNKLWGDKIINGISSAAYNIAGLIPSVNQKRQEADLATRDQALAQLKALRDYQAGGGRGGEAVNASIKAYEQISKIEETRLRLGKSITSEQAATLDIYREQLEIMEKAAQKQGQAYNDSRKARNEQMNYVKILQAAAENEIRKSSGPIYRAGAGSVWLNRVGANYMPGMDLTQDLPTKGSSAARGVLKYVRENSNNSNIQWADIQSYANGDKTAQNYNIVAQAIERLRDTSAEAGIKVQELQKILEFNARSMSSNPDSLQYQAEKIGILESAQEQLSNIMQRVGNTNDVETLSQLGAEFKKIITTAMAIDEDNAALKELDGTINNVKATSNDYLTVMQQFIKGGGNVTSISEAMGAANEKLNKTMQDLVVKYNIAPEAVTELAQAMQAYAKDSSKAAEVVKILNDAINQSSAGMGKMSTQVDRVAKIQNIVQGISNLTMGLSSLTAIADTISNPDLSGWDKFVSILMSASMAIGNFSSIFKTLYSTLSAYTAGLKAATGATIAQAAAESFKNECDSKSFIINNQKVVAMIAEEAATKDLSIAQIKQRLIEEGCTQQGVALAIAIRLKKAATDRETGAVKMNIAQKLILLAVEKGIVATSLVFVGVLLVISTIVLGIIALINNIKNNSLAGQVKGLKDATAEASEAAAAARQNYEDLKSTINDYKDAKNSINELTKGTREFEDAVDKANEKARALISDYGITDWTIDANGVIQIDEEALEAAQDKARQAAKDAEDVQSASSAALAGKQKEQSINDSDLRTVNYDLQGNLTNNTGGNTTSTYTASTDNMTKLIDAMNNFETGAIGFFEGGEENFRSRVIEVLGWTEDGLSQGQEVWIESLYTGRDALLKLADSAAIAEAKLRGERQLAAVNNLENSTDPNVRNSKYKSQMADVIVQNEEKTKQFEQDAETKINNKTDEEKYEAYAKAKGYESWRIGTWADGLEEFQDADGQAHKVSDETITNFLIEQEIQKKLGTSNEDIVKNTVNYENSNNALDQAVAAYAMSSGDFSSLAGQFSQETLQQLASLLNSTNANANQDYIDYIKSVIPDFTSDDAFNFQEYFADDGQYESNQKKALDNKAAELANSYGVTESYAQNQIETIMDLGGVYEDNVEKASEVVDSLLQTQKQLDITAKSWKDNKDAIKNWANGVDNSFETQEKVKELQENLSKLFDGTKFDDKFIKDNLETIQAALEGDEEAYKRLQKKATEEVIFNITGKTNFDELDPMWQELYNQIENIPDLEIGASIDQTGLSNAFQALLDSGAITVDQMNSILSGIGFTPEVAYLELTPSAAERYIGKNKTRVQVWDEEAQEFVTKEATGDSINEVSAGQNIRIPIIGKNAMASAQTFASNNSGAKITGNLSTYVGKGSAGSLSSPSSSGGGGGGGSKKDKKKASDEIERYHVVKQQLDRLSSEYDQLSAAKDRAYGPDKLRAIDKEIAKLQEQEAMQKRYLNEIERYYQQDRAAIAKYGAVFDANGIITNYDALMQKQLDIFNASLTDEAEEAYNAFKETLDQYEETLALKLEESGNLLDKQYEIVSAKLEKITYKVEYKIEIEDDKLDYLERRLTRLSEVEKASLQVFAINQDKIMSYWIQYTTYAEAIKDIEAEINAQKAKGLEITDEQIQKLRDYKNSMGEIEDNIYDLYNDEIDSISDRYSNLFDQLEKYQDRIRDYRDSLETIKDMYSLLGVATVEDNRAMNDSIRKTYQAEAKGIQNEIDLLKARREELYKARDSLGKSVDKQGHLIDGIVADIKQLEDVGDLTIMEDSTIAYSQKLQDQIDEIDQQVHEKQMELISLASDYLNAIKDQWIDNLELIGQKTKDALYEGLEWAIDKYGDLTDLSELYLSDTRKIYELNKLNRSIQADINKIDNVAAKTKLRDLMKDINGYYADNVKMSEYELKNLQAQYELRLAEIALEDARNAKSEVRLTRDNEGRWGYMYTANTEEVDKAEQELEDKRYELQQLQEDTLKDAGEKILALQNDYIDAMTELQSSDLSDEQKKQRAEELTSLYQKQLDYYYKTYAQALEASGLAYEETILGQATNTKSLQEVMETFGHASIEMTDQMISETQKYQEAFIQMVSEITGKQINSYEEAQKAWMEYMSDTQKALNEATTQATDNFNKVAEAIKNMSIEFKKMIDELMVYLARLSGEDMSLLFYSALANGDYEMAERYAKARRQKIDSNPDEYGQYDWNTEKMNQIIDEKAKKDKPLTEEERKALLATAKEPYKTDKPGGWAEEMQDALKAGEYDKAGQYAEYRAYKVHNAGTQAEYAWTEADLQRQIDQYAKDPNEMTEAQRRRILATASQYDTGGYTGSWGNEGRWALLHEKELVLNKNDTSNLLTTITLLHDLMARLDQASAWSALRELTPASATTTTEILEQNVHIEASFPNAVDHNEIEQAFENIVNLASQYANRK